MTRVAIHHHRLHFAPRDEHRLPAWWHERGAGFWFIAAVVGLAVFGVVLAVIIWLAKGSGESSNNPSLGPPAVVQLR